MTDTFRVSHRASLLVVMLLVSSLFVGAFMNGASGASLENTIHVKNEDELKSAILNTSIGESTNVILDNDIIVTDFLPRISANKTITLTSNKVSGYYTLFYPLSVESGGVLKLDGVIIRPFEKTFSASGVWVSSGGQFFMYSGEISGHTYFDFYETPPPYNPFFDSYSSYNAGQGGGVRNYGVFEMYGGVISGNTAGDGGGVYNQGTFKMFGGEISNNTAGSGGGVCNHGTFKMFGGEISGNTANSYGGGVYTAPWGLGDYYFFEMFGGKIFGNTAMHGSDVFPEGSGGDSGSSSIDNNGDSSNGNNGLSNGNNGGSSNGGDGLDIIGDGGGLFVGGFSLRDVVFIGVGVVVVVVGVVVAVLFFAFKKELMKDVSQ